MSETDDDYEDEYPGDFNDCVYCGGAGKDRDGYRCALCAEKLTSDEEPE